MHLCLHIQTCLQESSAFHGGKDTWQRKKNRSVQCQGLLILPEKETQEAHRKAMALRNL